MNRSELKVDYDAEMNPVSASCNSCGERMPAPPEDLRNSSDIIAWFAGKYIDHRAQMHSQDDRRRVPRD